jgi:hypothetical protein
MSCNSCAVEAPTTRTVRSAPQVQTVRVRNPQPREVYEVTAPVRTTRTVLPVERIPLVRNPRVVHTARPQCVEEEVERIPVEAWLGPDSDILRPRLTGQCCPIAPRTTFPPAACCAPGYGSGYGSGAGYGGTLIGGPGVGAYGAHGAAYPSISGPDFGPYGAHDPRLGAQDELDHYGAPAVLPPHSGAGATLSPGYQSTPAAPFPVHPGGVSEYAHRMQELSGPRGVLAGGSSPLGGVHRVGGYGYGAPYGYGGGPGIRASGYDSAGYGPIGGAMPVSYSGAQYDYGGAYPPARSLYSGADPYLAGGSPGRYARGSGYGYGAGYGGSGIGQRAYGYGGRGAAGGCSSCSM